MPSMRMATEQDRELARELVDKARTDGLDLVGPEGVLTGLTKQVLETALEEELTEHLGYDKYDPAGHHSGNSRNGTRAKTLLTEVGPVSVDVPRDRAGTFTPVIVPKGKRRLEGVTNIVLSLTARGLTTGEISAHFAEVYGASLSKDTISRISDRVLEEMTEWLHRPLDAVYPVIFIDAIVVKVRDGQVTNKPFYVVVGVTTAGERDILGIWAGDGGEGAKYWLNVLTEIKNRGVADVLIAVCDGLKGLPESINTVWEKTLVQTCVIHLLRKNLPVRRPPGLGRHRQRPAPDLHRRDRRAGRSRAAGIRRLRDGQQVSGHRGDVDERLGAVHPVPGLPPGRAQDHLHHQRDRVAELPTTQNHQESWALPQRRRGSQTAVAGDP